MSTKLSFREAFAQLEETPAEPQGSSGFPRISALLKMDNIRQPVEVARTLKRLGLSLRKSHEILNRLAASEIVAAEFVSEDADRVIADLAAVGVRARAIVVPNVDVRKVREGLLISQVEFATRFGLEVDTLRNWEQDRHSPDKPARVLLKLIEQSPHLVEEALTNDRLHSMGDGFGSVPANPLSGRPSVLSINTMIAGVVGVVVTGTAAVGKIPDMLGMGEPHQIPMEAGTPPYEFHAS